MTIKEESSESGQELVSIRTTQTGAKSLERLLEKAKTVAKDLHQESPLDDVEITVIEEPYQSSRRLMAIRWYGGKYSHLDWLLPLLPKSERYCEVFGGSAAVLLNKEPSAVETFNDLDGALVNFFKVLRDKPGELIEKLYGTPFSREEFTEAYMSRGRSDLSEVEAARQFFVSAEQVRIGLAQNATPGRWAWCVLTSRRGMAGGVSRWLNRIEGLWAVAERLRSVQIENLDAVRTLEQYDTSNTLFYCDPPYIHETRGDRNAYGYEMDENQHRKLSECLHMRQGHVALSGYDATLMKELYKDWRRIDAPERIIHSVKEMRQESLWVNYNLEVLGRDTVEKMKKNGVKFNRNQSHSLHEFESR